MAAAIPASKIVRINPRVIGGGSADLQINGLFITSNPLMEDDTVKEYTSAKAVGEFFGLDSQEYQAALVYFNGFENKTTTPKVIYFGRQVGGPEPGWAEETMSAIVSETRNFVTFTTIDEMQEEAVLNLGQWANASDDEYLYVGWTTAEWTLNPDDTNDPASVLKDNTVDRSCIVYGPMTYAAFIMGTAASIDYARANGAITFAFKRQSGLAAFVTNETDSNTLDAKNCNYMGKFATRNAEFTMLYKGVMSASDYGFIDPYLNAVWLNNRIQVACMDGLAMSNRVGYDTQGYTTIRAWLADPIEAALNNGVISPGVSLSNAQKNQLLVEAGEDIAPDIERDGYYLQILDPGSSVRAQRGTPVINLWYAYSGAIHSIEIASTALL